MNTKIKIQVLFFLIVIFSANLFGQQIDPTAKIPMDPGITKGKLDNGLTYYIRENKKPENRVEMRMVVKVGSLQEDDDQQGLAHFLEHMCFNGTKNFEKHALVDFLEETGVRFGADLNAYTSFDQTVYFFQIPAERESLIDTAFMVLSDWAQHVSLDHDEIDKERGVVIEEWRLGLGANDRMSKEYYPVILKGSRYENRLPIGKKEIIENFEYNVLKRFYNDWYRPDLMAVIVVGDIDKELMEQKIIENFSSMKMPENVREYKEYDIPDNEDPLISIATDVEAPYNVINLFYKSDKEEEVIIEDYGELIKQQLYNRMLGERLNEIIQKPEAPFIFANSGYGGFFGRTKNAFSSVAVSKEHRILESLETLLAENEKVKRYGFTQSELERAKKEILTFYENALNELGKSESRSYADEYKRNFLENEPIPGIENEYAYAAYFVPKFNLEELNALASEWITDENMVLVVTAPEREDIEVPTKEQLLKVIEESSKKELEAYVDNAIDKPLLENKPAPGKIVKEKYNKQFGYTELVLDNGVKVMVKTTDFKNDEILFSGYSKGGTSTYPDKDALSAMLAARVLNLSGVGEFDNVTLQKLLAGNTAGVSVWFGEYSEGMNGSCSPKDLETLFQLAYLKFSEIPKDSVAFNSYVDRLSNQIKFMNADPQAAYTDTLYKIITSNDPRTFIIPTQEEMRKVDLNIMHDIYNDRFADASDFVFTIVGNIHLDSCRSYIEQYLGSLPVVKRKEKWVNVEPDFPDKTIEANFKKGLEPKSTVTIVMHDDMKWKRTEVLEMNMMMRILSIMLRESLREDQGGTYGVRAAEETSKIPVGSYTINISFGCSPENVDSLVNSVFNEISLLQKEGPSDKNLNKVKETLIRERETNEKNNGFWRSTLQAKYSIDRNLLTNEEFNKLVEGVTKEDIKDAAVKYLTPDHYVKLVLYPEMNEKEN